MKIGIDVFGCDHGRSGFGSYVSSFVRYLPDSADLSFELFGPEIDRYTYTAEKAGIKYNGVTISDTVNSQRFWHSTVISSFLKKSKYDVCIFTAGTRLLPRKFDIPSIVIVQDVVSKLFESKDIYYNMIIKNSLKKADLLVAASQFIKDDIINCLKIPESKIIVIYNGLDHDRFYPRPKNNENTILIQPFSIRRPYIIYASRIEYPVKHHIELIKAFEAFKKSTGLPHRLVLAGSDGQNAEIVHNEVLKSDVSSDIFLTGFFPPQNLPELYAGADACVFPSSCEGVGFPVLETMGCGIPVGCANAGSLPEITGDCVLLFNPENVEEIASAIEKLVCNTTLRESLIIKSIDFVKKYSWEDTVSKTIEVAKKILKE